MAKGRLKTKEVGTGVFQSCRPRKRCREKKQNNLVFDANKVYYYYICILRRYYGCYITGFKSA